jgi:hypothetical protein
MWWLETVRLESKLVQKKCCYEILIAVAYFTGDDGFLDFEIERVDRYRMSCPEMLSLCRNLHQAYQTQGGPCPAVSIRIRVGPFKV